MRTIETFLPVFPGFYNTIFEPFVEPEIDYINEKRIALGLPEIDFDEIDFDFKTYMIGVGKQCCDTIERELKYIFPEILIEFQEIKSPKEYNFTNDSINCAITINIDSLMGYLVNHSDEFQKYTHERYTSRSGFVSFYSDGYKDWIEYLKSGNRLSHVIGSCLDFVCNNEGIDPETLRDQSCNETIEAKNYDELVPDYL